MACQRLLPGEGNRVAASGLRARSSRNVRVPSPQMTALFGNRQLVPTRKVDSHQGRNVRDAVAWAGHKRMLRKLRVHFVEEAHDAGTAALRQCRNLLVVIGSG